MEGAAGDADQSTQRDWFNRQADLDELARSQWGLWSDECDEVILAQLAESYVARKRWEFELQAGYIIRLLGTAMGGEAQDAPSTQRIPADEMVALIGGFS